MLIAYFDESGLSERDDFFSVAAMVGSIEDWQVVDEKFRAALSKHGAPYLHMREFAHRIEAFKGWDEPRRKSLMRDCLDALHSRPIAPVATAMDSMSERWRDKQGREVKIGPLFRCFAETLSGIKVVASKRMDGGIIRSVYSQQDEFKHILKHVHETSHQYPPVNARMEPLEFGDTRDVPGLQLADLLAYELRHFYHRRRKAPGAMPRIPLQELHMQYVRYYRSRLSLLKYLPDWLLKAERDGTLPALLDEIYGDMNKHGERILEQWPFPLDLGSYKELEAYGKSPSRKPHVMFVPAGTFSRRRNRQFEPPARPSQATPDHEE